MLKRCMFGPGGEILVVEAILPQQSSLAIRELAQMAGVPMVIGSVFHLMYTREEVIEAEHDVTVGLGGHLTLDPSRVVREAQASGVTIIFEKK